MQKKENNKVQLAEIALNIDYIKKDIAEIKRNMRADYVKKSEFEPVKKIVYGLVSIVLVGVATALVALVLK